MTTLTPSHTSNLSLPSNTYIYKILPTGPRTASPTSLSILSSDDSVRFLDPSTLSLLPDGVLKKVHHSVTCLEPSNDAAGNIIATAGRDGLVKFWDSRSKGNGKAAMTVQVRMWNPVSVL
jgi:WD40 repeat protein